MKHRNILAAYLLLVTMALSAGDTVTFGGLTSRSRVIDGERQVVLTGDAWIETGDIRISSEEIVLSGSSYRFAECTGSVIVEDRGQDIRLSTTRLSYDRVTTQATARGWAELEDPSGELIARGGFISNNSSQRTTLIQIAARILKSTDEGAMLCRADSILYDEAAQELELTGNAVVLWNQDEYRAAFIRINLETNEISLEGDVSGVIYD